MRVHQECIRVKWSARFVLHRRGLQHMQEWQQQQLYTRMRGEAGTQLRPLLPGALALMVLWAMLPNTLCRSLNIEKVEIIGHRHVCWSMVHPNKQIKVVKACRCCCFGMADLMRNIKKNLNMSS